jgi:hypothetical protein
MVSSISAYFFNTSVRYSGGIETACAATRDAGDELNHRTVPNPAQPP